MSSPSLTIRPAAEPDVPDINRMVHSAYRNEGEHRGWTSEAGLLADNRTTEADILRKIQDVSTKLLLAHDPSSDNRLVACCELVRQDDEIATLNLFCVDPEYQGGGIGKRMVTEAEVFAKETWKARRMELSVLWMREELVAWYGRRGYTPTGKTWTFPYDGSVTGTPLRDDLYCLILGKDLGP